MYLWLYKINFRPTRMTLDMPRLQIYPDNPHMAVALQLQTHV